MTFVLLYQYQQQEISLHELEKSLANLPQLKVLKKNKSSFVEKQRKYLNQKEDIQKLEVQITKAEREGTICQEEAKRQSQLLYNGSVKSQREITGLSQQVASLQNKANILQDKLLQLLTQKEEETQQMQLLQNQLQKEYAMFQKLKQEYEMEKRGILAEIVRQKNENTALWDKINENLRKWYLDNKAYFNDVPLTVLGKNNACGNCHTVVPAMTGRHARKNPGRIRCEKCGRYFLAEEEMK